MQLYIRVLASLSLILAGYFSLFKTTVYAQTANPGDNLVVCGNSNWGGISSFNTQYMRDKLSNTANFGPTGTYSTSTFSFVNVGTPTTANLAANNCNIWFSGYDPGAAYTALSTFAANGGFVIGGCDNSNYDAVCNGVGVNVTNYSNVGGGYTNALPVNPLTCDGGTQNNSLNLTTAGGASSYFTSGQVLARYSDANAYPLAIIDDNYTPSYLLTGDIDMFTRYNSQVTAGGNITSDQDKFIANVFKLAADKVTGLLNNTGEPNCGNISSGVVATNDDFSGTAILAGNNSPTVYTNDLIDAVTVTTGSVTPTITSTGGLTGISINADGTLSIPSSASSGNYTVTYQICDASDPTECDTATVLLLITQPPFIPTLPSANCEANFYGWLDTHDSSLGSGESSPPYTIVSGSYDWDGSGNPVWTGSGTPTTTINGVTGDTAPELETSNSNTGNSEAWQIITRMEGTSSAAGTVEMVDGGGVEHSVYVVRDVSGTVLARYPAAASTSNRGNSTTTMNFTYPANGVVYVYQYFADYQQAHNTPRIDNCGGAAQLAATKTVEVFDPGSTGLYAVPGNDVIYTITSTNTGDGAADTDSLVLIDLIPAEVEFYNGDIDGSGPETDPVAFQQTGGAGLSFSYSTDVRLSTASTTPANFSACSVIAPDGTYRPDIKYICFNPKGSMADGDPDPTFSVSFRARIK